VNLPIEGIPMDRLKFRLRYSLPIVNRIFKSLNEIRLAGKEYGAMVHRAVNYMLEDESAFRKFLSNGQLEMHNNAVGRMFRYIAMGRRNRPHAGSHFAAENIVFMYSLYESCKLNHVHYGEYVEYVLDRILHGDELDENHLPNHYLDTIQSVTEKVVG
jgi:transposase